MYKKNPKLFGFVVCMVVIILFWGTVCWGISVIMDNKETNDLQPRSLELEEK